METEYQVQIWNDEVEEWYGWAFTDYDATDRKDCEKAERAAKQAGWKTRVVEVVPEVD